MNCAMAIQVLPMDAANDDEVCRVVDAVIDYIRTQPVSLFVGPFESTIEGDYDVCMAVLKRCQEVAFENGCAKVLTYAKIECRPAHAEMLTTERKVGKYAEVNQAFEGTE